MLDLWFGLWTSKLSIVSGICENLYPLKVSLNTYLAYSLINVSFISYEKFCSIFFYKICLTEMSLIHNKLHTILNFVQCFQQIFQSFLGCLIQKSFVWHMSRNNKCLHQSLKFKELEYPKYFSKLQLHWIILLSFAFEYDSFQKLYCENCKSSFKI